MTGSLKDKRWSALILLGLAGGVLVSRNVSHHMAGLNDTVAAVRAELSERGDSASPQTRDMNPIYTGKDVSFIDTKQANTLFAPETRFDHEGNGVKSIAKCVNK